jgi:putative glutamine amidotransferase
MKLIGLTQRVQDSEGHGERRDCLDQQWLQAATQMGFTPLPLPNLPPGQVPELCERLALSGLILTGGNSLAAFAPQDPAAAPERDAFEMALLDWAVRERRPVIGVCRGLQMINVYFGGQISRIEKHAGCRHSIRFEGRLAEETELEVNSYHDWAVQPENLAGGLQVLARHGDGSIEAFEHVDLPIIAMMWHPEREPEVPRLDMRLIKEILE